MDTTKVITQLATIYGKTLMETAFSHDPFQFLAAVMLSARSRDSITIPVAQKLFALAPTPEAILQLPTQTIESILHPIGFYRVKTKYLQGLSLQILQDFAGKAPDTFERLTSLSGVSRKVANVVLSQLFDKQVIAVDTHVHRISNRLGWVATTKPEETERELMKVVPKIHWRTVNRVLVMHGQAICLPLHPKCEICPISQYCPKIGLPAQAGVL